MNDRQSFEHIQSVGIKTAKNIGSKNEPMIEITLKDKTSIIVDKEFLNNYSIYLKVEKSKPTYWGIKEKK